MYMCIYIDCIIGLYVGFYSGQKRELAKVWMNESTFCWLSWMQDCICSGVFFNAIYDFFLKYGSEYFFHNHLSYTTPDIWNIKHQVWNIHINTSSDISLPPKTEEQIQQIFMLSAFTWAAIMKTKCMHTSDKYQEINKNKVSKPNERLFIIRLVMSLAPSAPSFPLISPSYRRQSNHVAAV